MNRRLAASVGITATGQHYPDRVVTNQEMEQFLDTSDEWISTRTGIRQRRWAEPGTGSSDLGAKALLKALEARNLGPDDLDGIIACTVTPDFMFPTTAALIAKKVGASRVFGFDLNAACGGFLFGLSNACSMVAAGGVKRLAVVGCEVMSSIIDRSDRNTAVLFGDGAGAVIVEAVDEGFGLLDFEMRVNADGADLLKMPAGGSVLPASAATVAAGQHYVHQQGQDVYKHAVREMSEFSRLMLDRNGLEGDDIRLLVPHQANLRIMEAVAKRLNLPAERMACNIGEYANTTAATIPTALHQCHQLGQLKKGDPVVLTAFGAGFSFGAALMRWAY